MLILSRKAGQSIVIDEKVTVKVVSVKGQEVRLGIEAPADVAVRRDELAAGSREQRARSRATD